MTQQYIALLGDPVSHSLSPVIHNAAFRHLGLGIVYRAIRVPASDLAGAVRDLTDGAFLGANVTIPHKESILSCLDRLDPVATTLGAVNTVRILHSDETGQNASLEGSNTDVAGFSQPLSPYTERVRDAACLVWGSGGAARAVVYALTRRFHADKIFVISRSADRARRMSRELAYEGTRIEVVPWDMARTAIENATLLVNATPLGMIPGIDSSPCDEPELISDQHIVYDLVYNPQNTRLLSDARRRGATPIGGLEMLIGQASESFRCWTGTQMPLDIVRQELTQFLEKGHLKKSHPKESRLEERSPGKSRPEETS